MLLQALFFFSTHFSYLVNCSHYIINCSCAKQSVQLQLYSCVNMDHNKRSAENDSNVYKRLKSSELQLIGDLCTSQMSPTVRYNYEVARGNLIPLSDTNKKFIKRSQKEKSIDHNVTQAQLLLTSVHDLLQLLPYTSDINRILHGTCSTLSTVYEHLDCVRYETCSIDKGELYQVFCAAILSCPKFAHHKQMVKFVLKFIGCMDRCNDYLTVVQQSSVQIEYCYDTRSGIQFVRLTLFVINGDENHITNQVKIYIIDGIEMMAVYTSLEEGDYIRHALGAFGLHVIEDRPFLVVLKSNFKFNYRYDEIENNNTVVLNSHQLNYSSDQ
jgi:hypothetical protein